MFFKCPVEECSKLFNCKKALKEHERTHNSNRPFKCAQCDQTFTQYSSLQKHARVHDKQKPYTCEHPGCKQAFSQVSNLIRHQRIHSGEKPFACDFCDKKFASGSNLKQHLQIHQKQDGRSNFECIFDGCSKNYLYQSSLKKHYLVCHKEAYEELLQESKISTCGFKLKNDQKDALEAQLGKPQQNLSNISEKEPVVNPESQNIVEQDEENKTSKAQLQQRIVEKGLQQSLMIRENPLCQNLTIGKRGRPKNADKILKEKLKRQKMNELEQINNTSDQQQEHYFYEQQQEMRKNETQHAIEQHQTQPQDILKKEPLLKDTQQVQSINKEIGENENEIDNQISKIRNQESNQNMLNPQPFNQELNLFNQQVYNEVNVDENTNNSKDDKILNLINQIQDTFTDDKQCQMATNMPPMNTQTLEQQLLQSTAPKIKHNEKDNQTPLAQNLQELLAQMQYVQSNQYKDIQKDIHNINTTKNQPILPNQSNQFQFSQQNNLAGVFEMLLLKLVQEQDQHTHKNYGQDILNQIIKNQKKPQEQFGSESFQPSNQTHQIHNALVNVDKNNEYQQGNYEFNNQSNTNGQLGKKQSFKQTSADYNYQQAIQNTIGRQREDSNDNLEDSDFTMQNTVEQKPNHNQIKSTQQIEKISEQMQNIDNIKDKKSPSNFFHCQFFINQKGEMDSKQGAQQVNDVKTPVLNCQEGTNNVDQLEPTLTKIAPNIENINTAFYQQDQNIPSIDQNIAPMSMPSIQKPSEIDLLDGKKNQGLFKNMMGNMSAFDFRMNKQISNMSSNSLLQNKKLNETQSKMFGSNLFTTSPLRVDKQNQQVPKPKESGQLIRASNSFIMHSQRSISKQNLYRNSFNLLDQKSQKSKVESKFSSCVNLMGQTKINEKNKGLVVNASTIFDKLGNVQMVNKPPSIQSQSNKERSSNNLLKSQQQGLNEINPQQAHDLLQRIYKHDPDKLKHLIRESQQSQTRKNSFTHRGSFISLTSNKDSQIKKQQPNLLNNKQGFQVRQQHVNPIGLQTYQENNNRNFISHLRAQDKQGNMSTFFNQLHQMQQENGDNGLQGPSNTYSEQDQSNQMNMFNQQANLQNIVESIDLQKKDKSRDEFDDDEDAEVDNLFLNDMQENEPIAQSIPNINQQIEDFNPKISDTYNDTNISGQIAQMISKDQLAFSKIFQKKDTE